MLVWGIHTPQCRCKQEEVHPKMGYRLIAGPDVMQQPGLILGAVYALKTSAISPVLLLNFYKIICQLFLIFVLDNKNKQQ